MPTKILLYSRTGRNKKLAGALADKIDAEIVPVTEPGKRTISKIALDLLFGRFPKVDFDKSKISSSDYIILMGPVWFGKIAFPLRTVIRELEERLQKYAFVSLSGGGDGPNSNPNLENELTERVGKKPQVVVNLHVADLIQVEEKPTPKEIDKYEVTDKDISEMVEKIQSKLEVK